MSTRNVSKAWVLALVLVAGGIGLIPAGSGADSWVKTDMGGPGASITPSESAAGIVKVIDQLSLQNTGGFWKWNGSRHDW